MGSVKEELGSEARMAYLDFLTKLHWLRRIYAWHQLWYAKQYSLALLHQRQSTRQQAEFHVQYTSHVACSALSVVETWYRDSQHALEDPTLNTKYTAHTESTATTAVASAVAGPIAGSSTLRRRPHAPIPKRVSSIMLALTVIAIACLPPLEAAGAPFRSTGLSASFYIARGGAGQRPPPLSRDEYDDSDHDNFDRRVRRPPRGPPPRRRPTKPKTPPLWSRLASQSAKLSGQALSATARTSGKVAYNLMSPKHVEWRELVGLWRLDQWMNEEDRPIQSSMELTIRKMVLVKQSHTHQKTLQVPCHFKPAAWPRSARLEYKNPTNGLIYYCTVHRKLADKKVLKLRGKIYEKRWGRKVLVGTFIGRRRLKLLTDDGDEEEESDDDDEFDESNEEEEGEEFDESDDDNEGEEEVEDSDAKMDD